MLPSAIHHIQFVLMGLLVPALFWAGVRELREARPWRQAATADAAALACCLLLALALRLCARTFPDGFFLASAQGVVIGDAHRWGAGFSAILHFLYLFLPPGVATVAGMNVVIGAATALLLFAFVDEYFGDRLAAFAAAAMFSCQPVLVRWAASDSAHVLLTFCLFAACLCLALWDDGGKRTHLLQAVGWLALAANVRPEAVSYALVGALVLAGGGARMAREKPRDLIVAAALYLLFLIHPLLQIFAALSPPAGVDMLQPFGFLHAFFLSPYSSPLVCALAVLGALWASLARRWQGLAFLLALVVVSLPTGFTFCFDEPHRLALPHLAAWCVFAGCGFSAAARLLARGLAGAGPGAGRRRIPPLAAAAALAVALATAAPHRALLRKTWTHSLEYEFFMPHLRDIPDGCVMVGPGSSNDESRGLRIIPTLSRLAGKGHRWLAAPDLRDDELGPCTVFYRATACFSYEASRHRRKPWKGAERPVCRDLQSRFSLEPLATASIPAIHYADEAYVVNPIPVGFYRLSRKPPRGPRGGRRTAR